jgi:hypothetical protein
VRFFTLSEFPLFSARAREARDAQSVRTAHDPWFHRVHATSSHTGEQLYIVYELNIFTIAFIHGVGKSQ